MISYNKSKQESSKRRDERRKDESRAPQEERYSHLEWIQFLSVGGLLPLQTVCQLRADLSRRKSINTIKHLYVLISYISFLKNTLFPKYVYLFVVCNDTRRPPDLLLGLLQLSSKYFLQLYEERKFFTHACQKWHQAYNDRESSDRHMKDLPLQLPPLFLSSPFLWPAVDDGSVEGLWRVRPLCPLPFSFHRKHKYVNQNQTLCRRY